MLWPTRAVCLVHYIGWPGRAQLTIWIFPNSQKCYLALALLVSVTPGWIGQSRAAAPDLSIRRALGCEWAIRRERQGEARRLSQPGWQGGREMLGPKGIGQDIPFGQVRTSRVGLTCGRALGYTQIMASPQVSQLQTRVLLISDESPLSLGVEAVLRDRLVLEVICDVDRASIRERIRTFQPDAVVLGAACKADEPAPNGYAS